MLLNIVLGFIFLSAHSDTTYVVNYREELQVLMQNGAPAKIPLNEELQLMLGKDSVLLSEVLKPPYIWNVNFEFNSKGEYSFTKNSTHPMIRGTGTKFYYRDGKYYTSENSSGQKPLELKVEKENGTKEILGYNCQKFIAKDSNDKVIYEIYATDQLPGFITAEFRFPSFGLAILEIRKADGSWMRTATEFYLKTKPLEE